MSGFPEASLTNTKAVPFGPIWAWRSSPGRSVSCWNDRGTEPAAPLPRAADPPPDLEAAAEQGERGEGERDVARPPAPLRQRLDGAALGDRASQAVEVEGEVPRRLEALVGVLLQAVLDDEVERLRDARVGLRGQGRLVAQDRADELGRARAGERAAAGEHLVEHRPQREDVRPVVGHLALGLLGGQVADRADHRPGVRGPGGGRRAAEVARAGEQRVLPGEAEVEDLDAPVVQEEEVLGLDVAVDDALVVRGGQALRHARRVLGGLAHADRPLAQPRAHRLALEQLRHHEEPIALLAGVVDRDDVGVRERRHRLRLGLEAGERVGVIGEVLGQDLDRHVALEAGVAGAVDLPHPAGAERRDDLVRAEAVAGREAHGSAAIHTSASSDRSR